MTIILEWYNGRMYRNNELQFFCKFCGKEGKVKAITEKHKNGNFCSQECWKRQVIKKRKGIGETKNERKKWRWKNEPEYRKKKLTENRRWQIKNKDKFNYSVSKWSYEKRHRNENYEVYLKSKGVKKLLKLLKKRKIKLVRDENRIKNTKTCFECDKIFLSYRQNRKYF